ncbi:hypothetical protein [Sorangium sp. So ce1097]|uniref:hypothetical protein n=1 Tax=Sorangium sp. So ce1097 TaxID=3133330 RepID=UPI003F61C7CE
MPSGLTVVEAALAALGRLDQAHAMVYFQLIWNGLREPMRQALEALVMERQAEGEATFPPFVQKLVDRGKLEGMREGKLEGVRRPIDGWSEPKNGPLRRSDATLVHVVQRAVRPAFDSR